MEYMLEITQTIKVRKKVRADSEKEALCRGNELIGEGLGIEQLDCYELLDAELTIMKERNSEKGKIIDLKTAAMKKRASKM